MYKVSVSVMKNRLYLHAEGQMGIVEVNEVIDEINKEVRKLRTGFNVISDLSGFDPASESVSLAIQRALKSLKMIGLGNLIRVIPSQKGVAECNAKEVLDCQWLKDFRNEGKIAEDVCSFEIAESRMDALDLNGVCFG